MDKLLKELNIDEKLTKPVKKVKKFNKVKDNIPLFEDYNFMSDILMLPMTKHKYRYLLVMVDLATDEFDIEALRTKDSAEVVLAAKRMYKRKHLNQPYASIRTDAGTEFKGEFATYLHKESILHKQGLPGRHKQMSNVESLNRTLGRLFNGYMNSMEEKTGKVYKEWTDVVEKVRKQLNIIRVKDTKKIDHKYPVPDFSKKNKFKEGEFVYRPLDQPRNTLNEKVYGDNFRMGDNRFDAVPRLIKQIVYYSGDVTYRYLLKGLPNVSYAEHELMKADDVEGEDEIGEVKKILDKRFFDEQDHYKIWFYEELKKDAGWYTRTDLMKTIPDLIKEYDKEHKKQPTKKAVKKKAVKKK
jgi:hypothetical protein